MHFSIPGVLSCSFVKAAVAVVSAHSNRTLTKTVAMGVCSQQQNTKTVATGVCSQNRTLTKTVATL